MLNLSLAVHSRPIHLLGPVEGPAHSPRLLRRPPQIRRLPGHARLRRRHRLVLRRQRRRRAGLLHADRPLSSVRSAWQARRHAEPNICSCQLAICQYAVNIHSTA